MNEATTILADDLSSLTPAQLAVVREREAIVLAWQKAMAGKHARQREATTLDFLAAIQVRGLGRFCRATIHNWNWRYRADGLLGLADLRWTRRGPKATSSWPFVRSIVGLLLQRGQSNPGLNQIIDVHRIASQKAADAGWRTSSVAGVRPIVLRLLALGDGLPVRLEALPGIPGPAGEQSPAIATRPDPADAGEPGRLADADGQGTAPDAPAAAAIAARPAPAAGGGIGAIHV